MKIKFHIVPFVVSGFPSVSAGTSSRGRWEPMIGKFQII